MQQNNIHSCIIHNSLKEETDVYEWIDRQNVVYTCNGILFSLKKEWNSDTCCHTDEPWRCYAEWNKPVAKNKYCEIPIMR